MRRKFLSVVLCVCMMMTMAPFAFATEGQSSSSGGSGSPTFNGLITTADALQNAINTAKDNTTITVSGTIEISKPIDIDDTITITGTNNAEIKASSVFSGGYLIGLKTAGKTLTLGNIKLDANKKSRVVYCNAGKVVVNGATITGGETASSYIGGVYMTSNSEFEMNSGSITDNSVSSSYANDGYLQYSADLWIGANANGVLPKINGGTIGNVFVNANEYSATNPGGFTMNNGTITNLYVEYGGSNDKKYGASFTYNGGTIDNLYIATKEGDTKKVKINNPIAGMTYKGGQTSDDALTPVAQVGTTTYGTLEAAIAAATNEDTLTLLKNTSVASSISIDKNITIDLKGNNISLPEDSKRDLFVLNSGADLTIKSSGNANGTVSVPTTNMGSVVNLQSNSTFTLESGKLVGDYTVFAGKVTGTKIIVNGGSIEGKYGITAYGTGTLNDVAITVKDGEIKSTQSQSAIATNGSDDMGGVNLTINGGRIISENNLAVYLPGINGKTTVTNGTITGKTAIELRAGDLIVSGGSIAGTGHPVSVNPNGSGSTTDGVGISVAQHTTKRNTSLTISGGTISGFSAIYESNPQKNGTEDLAKVTLNITGGNFAAINGGTLSVYSEDKTGFISGGYFTTDPSNYCAENLTGIPSTELGYAFTVGEKAITSVKPATGEPDVTIPNTIDSAKRDVAKAVGESVTDSTGALSAAANQAISNVTEAQKTDAENAIRAANSGVTVNKGDTVNIYAQTYLKVTPTAYENNRFTLDIQPMYRVVASTKSADQNFQFTGDSKNAVVLTDSEKPLTNIQTMEISLELPSTFTVNNNQVYVQHKGHEYIAAVTTGENSKKIATFTNPDGFSEFTISKDPAAVATIGQNRYTTLQDAVDAVKDNETINVTGDNLSATVSGNKSFKVNANDKTVKLIAAFGYNLTNNGDTYTVSRQSSGGPGSSGGSISTPTTYAVNVNAATNGAVAADKKTASKGTTVTVTASPSKGYVVDAVKVVDKDGKDVAVTEKDGKYVFTMPASAVTVTGSFKAETPAPVALPFTDVKSGNWFYDAVKYAYAQGLMTGTSATTFAPNGTMNRAMIVTVLYRLEKSPAVTGASKFTDVPAGQWYSDAVAWAAANKIVNGYDETTFGPMNAVTREQMAAILFRYEQVKGLENVTLEENLNRFPDQNKISAYAIPALQWAVGQKIINGNADGTLDPTGTATRAQVAQIFTNLLNK